MAKDGILRNDVIWNTVVGRLPRGTEHFLPTKSSFLRLLRGICQRNNIVEPKINSDFILESHLCMDIDGENFVQCDTGPDSPPGERVIILGTLAGVERVSSGDILLMDGLHNVPRTFFQLYSIHVPVHGVGLPSLYALLESKTEATYGILIRKIKEICIEHGFPIPDPTACVVDFELAMMNTVETHFKGAKINGCFFHLNQNLYRQVHSKKYTPLLKTWRFKLTLKKLMALAYMREKDVEIVFKALQSRKGLSKAEKDMINYFGETYVIGKLRRGRGARSGERDEPRYDIPVWNIHQALIQNNPITNNSVECWHKQFQAMLKQICKGDMFPFLEKLKLDAKVSYARLVGLENNTEVPRQKLLGFQRSTKIRFVIEKRYESQALMITLNAIAKILMK